MTQVYIQGYSLVSALGDGVDEIHSSNQSSLATSSLSFELDDEPVSVNYFSAFKDRANQPARLSDNDMYCKIEQHILNAIEMAGWDRSIISHIPIFIGSTSYFISDQEVRLLHVEPENLQEEAYRQPFTLNLVASYLSEKYHNSMIFSFATSCTSGANALLYARQFVGAGYFDKAIIVGFESFNLVTLQGFWGLGLLAPQFAEPFSPLSEGLVLGEGIACLAIGTDNPSHLPMKLTLEGGATQGDTYNITATSPDGSKVSEVISKALVNAGILPEQVKAIKAHGTGGPANDVAEGLGILQHFSSSLPVLLLKPYIGHTLGACGVLETILMAKCLMNHYFPPLPYEFHDNQSLPVNVVRQGMVLTEGYYLCHYLGFAGNNTILVMKAEQ